MGQVEAHYEFWLRWIPVGIRDDRGFGAFYTPGVELASIECLELRVLESGRLETLTSMECTQLQSGGNRRSWCPKGTSRADLIELSFCGGVPLYLQIPSLFLQRLGLSIPSVDPRTLRITVRWKSVLRWVEVCSEESWVVLSDTGQDLLLATSFLKRAPRCLMLCK